MNQGKRENAVVRKKPQNILILRDQSDSGCGALLMSQHLRDISSGVSMFPGILLFFYPPTPLCEGQVYHVFLSCRTDLKAPFSAIPSSL